MDTNAVIVIPALNPPATLPDYVARLKQQGYARIIVVNDGSRTDKLPVFLKLKRLGAIVIDHDMNLGQGVALRTGFQYYLDHFQGDSDGVITLSADRQVRIEDVEKIGSALHNEQAMGSFALVVGTRDLNGRFVSDYDYRMGGIMKLLYHMLMGVHLNDPLSGVMGIPDLRIRQCMAIEGDGFAYVTSLTMSFEQIGFLQVPVEYVQYEEGVERSFRKVADTIRILYTIFKKFILYSITSVSASILDVILFSIFNGITFRGNPLAIIYSTVCARVISASVNYLLTKHYRKQLEIEEAERAARRSEREKELEAKRLETERLKAEGKTEKNANTSKKKIQANEKQKLEERKAALDRADRAVHGALGRHRQHGIPPVNPEAPHAVVRREEVEHLVRVRPLDAPVLHRHQLVPHRLHHRVHDRHPLQHALQRVQPDAAGHALVLLLRGGHLLRLLRLRGGRLRGQGRPHLGQVHRGGDVVQGKLRLVLLLQADGLQNPPGLIVPDDPGARLDGHEIAFADAAFPRHLLRGQLLTDPLRADQISQSAHFPFLFFTKFFRRGAGPPAARA